MTPKLLYPVIGILASVLVVRPVSAENVMDKVAETGILTGGTSEDAFPFAYKDKSGKLVGYSVDMMELIKAELETELQRPLTLQLVPLDSDERIPALETAGVDLVCDASSFTWERDRKIDFSVSYGITGTRLLVPVNSQISDPQSLAGKRIGALPKTTNETAIQKLQPEAVVILVQDRAEGYSALKAGKIDAFADDGILLDAWLQQQNNRDTFKVVGYPYSKEGIACMLPENNSAFQGAVDRALIRYMQGFLNQKPEQQAIFDRWFGPQGTVPMTQDFRELSMETMQLLLDFKQELPESTP